MNDNRIAQLEQRIALLERSNQEMKRLLQGQGAIIVHGSRFDIDKSARVSSMLNEISDIKARVTALEAE